MSDAVIVGILGFVGTLLGSLLGILAAQKLLTHRVASLEQKTESHDNDIRRVNDRTLKLEGRVQTTEHYIQDLKKYHAPR